MKKTAKRLYLMKIGPFLFLCNSVFLFPFLKNLFSLRTLIEHLNCWEQSAGDCIHEVRILPDRIEIVSHPGADRFISEEGLRTYRVFSRQYRNRRIGDFLKEMHLTEGRNTGFRKILNALLGRRIRYSQVRGRANPKKSQGGWHRPSREPHQERPPGGIIV